MGTESTTGSGSRARTVDPFSSEYGSDYLGDQLIAYIGNKRRLLGFLYEHISPLGTVGSRFFDGFSGSGAVAKLARTLGYRVHANDWEYYGAVLLRAALSTRGYDRELVERLGFSDVDGLFEFLNSVGRGEERAIISHQGEYGEPYIAAHFAPKDSGDPKMGRERLFYTRENAEFIDRVRWKIQLWEDQGLFRDTGDRDLLLAPLLYEASRGSNTSGVFKAYHKGFGGLGKDALGRILAPFHLKPLVQFPTTYRSVVTQLEVCEAAQLAGSVDIAYLDPPYNGHQYGSNYFMLNTIARWDRPPVNSALTTKGELEEKAGIRKDWVETRSNFCSKKYATQALSQLLDTLDAKHILLSYNTEGIVPYGELVEMLSDRGRLTVLAQGYTTYRGGRQSNGRKTGNAELLFSVESGSKTSQADKARALKVELTQRARQLLEKPMDFTTVEHKPLEIWKQGVSLAGRNIKIDPSGMLLLQAHDLDRWSGKALSELCSFMADHSCDTAAKTIASLSYALESGMPLEKKQHKLMDQSITRLANPKYREQFVLSSHLIEKLHQLDLVPQRLMDKVNQLRDRIDAKTKAKSKGRNLAKSA